jgi:hypothetical protein
MMTPSEVSSIIQSFGWLLAGVASVGNWISNAINARRAAADRKAIANKVDVIQVQSNEIHNQTNGMSARMEGLARTAGVAEGTAVGLEQGRREARP